MRLYLLPVSTTRSLLYCKRLPITPPPSASTSTSQSKTQTTISAPAPTILEKITTRASTTWLKWEAAEKGWQKTLTEYGNRAFQRIAFEEWGLKSVPGLSSKEREAVEQAGKDGNGSVRKIEVFYPSNVIPRKTAKALERSENEEEGIKTLVKKMATERQALHRKQMWINIIAAPFTAPFALVPIIPNIPFFYVAWRAYSHWKALTGSQHLEFLVKHNLLAPKRSPILEQIYAKSHPKFAIPAPSSTASTITATSTTVESSAPEPQTSSPQMTSDDEVPVLSVADAKVIGKELEVPEIVVEVERAVRQVEDLVEKREASKMEKKKE